METSRAHLELKRACPLLACHFLSSSGSSTRPTSQKEKGRHTPVSGKKKEPKPKLFDPDIFGWGGGHPRAGVGTKKFGMSKSLRKKFVFNLRSLQKDAKS